MYMQYERNHSLRWFYFLRSPKKWNSFKMTISVLIEILSIKSKKFSHSALSFEFQKLSYFILVFNSAFTAQNLTIILRVSNLHHGRRESCWSFQTSHLDRDNGIRRWKRNHAWRCFVLIAFLTIPIQLPKPQSPK